MLAMSKHFAGRLDKTGAGTEAQVAAAYRHALGREPNLEEKRTLAEYAAKHGLANACRLILNLNEFVFVD
jgi:hypothetical protein